MGGVTGLDASASIAGEEPKLAQLWDTFVQANPNLPELRFGDMLAGRLSRARRESEGTEDDDDGGLLLDQPGDWMDGANMRRRGPPSKSRRRTPGGTPTTTGPNPERMRSKVSSREGRNGLPTPRKLQSAPALSLTFLV